MGISLDTITITIHSDDGGITWETWADDDPLGRFKEPLTQGARALLKEGADPNTKLHLKHRGADHISLTSTVGHAASLTVQSDRFVRYSHADEADEA